MEFIFIDKHDVISLNIQHDNNITIYVPMVLDRLYDSAIRLQEIPSKAVNIRLIALYQVKLGDGICSS